MALSNYASFTPSTGQIPYQRTYQWDLCDALPSCIPGTYTIFLKLYTSSGVSSPLITKTITLAGLIPSLEEQALQRQQSREQTIEQLKALIFEVKKEIVRLLAELIVVLRGELVGLRR